MPPPSIEPPKAIDAIRSLLRTFPLEGAPEPSQNAALDSMLSEWTPMDRYQLVAAAATMVRWLAQEKGLSENAVLDSLVEENWPRLGK